MVDVQPQPMGRSLQKRREALVAANEVRVWRAQTKRRIKSGETTVTAVLMDGHPFAQTWKVRDVLLARRSVGRSKVTTWLKDVHISPTRTVGGMSQRQRVELLAVMGRWGL